MLDGPLSSFSQGFQTGLYALWLGSGISRERVVGLDGVLAKLLENLRLRITGVDCEHHHAFQKILNLADLSAAEKAQIDLSQPVASWPIHNELINRLWNKYSKVLGTEVDGQRFDYLLWDVLDFPTTFEAQKADAEHLAIAMLVLEGVVTDLATANWDGLLEAAMRELGRPNETFRVAVTGGDLQGPPGIGILYKFHGCANRAIKKEKEYRPLLVAREAAITHWAQNPRFTQMQEQLRALIARSRTLMIGLSGQDTNIQQLFSANKLPWSSDPAPIIFSAQELSDGQRSILEGAYQGDYEVNREQIRSDATLPAYGKPLLLALLLSTIFGKLAALAGLLTSPALDAAGKQNLVDGLKALEHAAAQAGNANRYECAQTIAALMGRVSEQFLGGPGSAGRRPYMPLSARPAHLMQQDPAVGFSGKPEAAAALGLIGQGLVADQWLVAVDDPEQPTSGALRLIAPAAEARVFLAANDDNINQLLASGAFDETDDDVVVICSRKVTPRQQRSPSKSWRTGKALPRYVSVSDLLDGPASFDEVQSRFNFEVAL
ncbi:SIR2 family protein [Thioclava marina]|uniref:SIR2 family protein n=1 Tax=Thioclava marina TaxID=1915077 RepID=UPI0023579E90|nr:SIR2 family protein [Thioclava marina]